MLRLIRPRLPSCCVASFRQHHGVHCRTYASENSLVVALVGPPNAGKSTLFARLLDKTANRSYRLGVDRKRSSLGRLGVGAAAAAKPGGLGLPIISPVPGTTRDCRECWGRLGTVTFRLLDTAGLDDVRLVQRDDFYEQMKTQTLLAAQRADVILLMFDAKLGMTTDLVQTVRQLRKYTKNASSGGGASPIPRSVVVLANKLEGDAWNYPGSPVLENLIETQSQLGFGEPLPISAQHGEGMAELAVLLEQKALEKQSGAVDSDDATGPDSTQRPLQLAILGRQNVGKSTLCNQLLGHTRFITGSTPGLTRDAIQVPFWWRPGKARDGTDDAAPPVSIQLVDTAGIRARTSRDYSNDIEELAVQDALRALHVADVAVLVLDAQAGLLSRQELAIARAIVDEGRSLVVVANKMDLVVRHNYSRANFERDVRTQLEERFPLLRQTPIVALSALRGTCVEQLMPVVVAARRRWERTISTAELNRWLADVTLRQAPPAVAGRALKIKYIIQTKGRPPTFLLFSSQDSVPQHYLRYLTRSFQDTFDMYGMEVRLVIKKSAPSNPYSYKEKKRSGFGLGGHEARLARKVANLKEHGTAKLKRQKRRKWPRFS